jgi:histidine triad (HIT) family protein
MANDCIFCKIVRGELPSFTVYEDEKTLAFLDIHPTNPGHTLVIPKADNTQNIFDVSAEDWAATTETARKVAHAVEKGMSADGVNIMMNNRSGAGQIVHHPHIHVIPRYKGDGLTHWKHRDYKNDEAEVVSKKIVSAFE